MTLYHGTDSLDFQTFDMSHVGPFNVGLHFGSEAAALSRIDYLRNESPDKPCRLLKCQVDIRNPLRVDDVFGHSYAGAFAALQDEAARQNAESSIRNEIDALVAEWMGSDDDPALTGGGTAYVACLMVGNFLKLVEYTFKK